MFALAIKDSFRFAKKHYLAFSSIVLLHILLNNLDFGVSFKNMSASEFLDIQGVMFCVYLLLVAFLWLGLLALFEIFKVNKKITFANFFKHYKMGSASVFIYAISFLLFIALLAMLFVFLVAIDFVAEVRIYEVYSYIAFESGLLLLLASIYIAAYVAFKLYFGLVFAFIAKDHLIIKSLAKAYQLITCTDVIKLSIALFSYLFVVMSVGRFFTEILELVMSEQSINFFKLGQFNFFGLTYMFVNSSICILSCLFVTSYGWMYYQKFNSKED